MSAPTDEKLFHAHCLDGAWRVVGPDRRPTAEVFPTMQRAASAAGAKNAVARRNARRTERKCLCCGSTFMSEGAHNRMCDDCRRDAQVMDTPYGVAPIRRHR